MKKLTSHALVGLIALIGTAAVMRSQQPSTQRYPQFENEHVKVWKSVVYPNAPLTMHRHDHPRVIIALKGGIMNLSGLSLAALIQEFEVDPLRDLLVIYDELDLVLGTFKIRERGSPAGHNGARSVTSALGSQEWLRLRIGVGPDLPPEAIVAGSKRPGRDFLLSPMQDSLRSQSF